MNDQTFVLVPQREYRKLIDQSQLPPLPVRDKDGTVEALPYMRASMARSIIRDRLAAGMTQKALADAAGVRIETINRIEKARVTPDTATIAKIDRALKRALKPKKRR